jgi:hypothetical protein
MPPPQAASEPHRGEHHRANPDNEEQIDEINVIFGGSMSIASKTQGKKLEREIILAQRIELERRMKWSDIDISFRPEEPERRMKWSNIGISFGPEDHPETELSNQNLPFVVKLLIGRHKVVKTGRQQGLTQPHNEENFHRDGPQSSGSDPHT